MTIWVVVADAGRARILSAGTRRGPLTEIENYSHTASRMPEQDLVSDRPGTGNDSAGSGRHSMGHEQEAHQREASIFAQQLCEEIDNGLRINPPAKIYLVAPAGFLGMLRSQLSKPAAARVAGEVVKDLVLSKVEDIRSHLPEYL